MFRESVIKDCFIGLAHFQQFAEPGYPTLDADLVTSETGRLINRVHPYLTSENIYNVSPMVAFSAWLRTLCEQSALELVSTVIQNKKLSEMSKAILESTNLFQGGALFTDRELKLGRFVGFQINLQANQNLLTVINSVGMQADGPLTGLPIYLYHSSKADPIATGLINVFGGLDYDWTAVQNFDLRSTGQGGTFYLGYYEDDLVGIQAISKRMDLSAVCGTCNRYNYNAYRVWSKRFNIASINVPTTGLDPAKKLFDTSRVVVTADRNYGLNLSINVGCDVSDFFCQNKLLFADVYVKLVGVNLIKQLAYNTRINAISEMVRQGAASELDPKKGSGSLMDEYNKALLAINYDFSDVDKECLPCNNRRGIRYGTI